MSSNDSSVRPDPDAADRPSSEPVSAKGLGIVPLLLSSPSEAFRRLAGDPQWIGAFVLVLILTALATWVRMPQDLIYGYEAAQETMERLGMSASDIDEGLARIPDPENLTPGRAAAQVAQAVAAVAIISFLGLLLFWVIARISGPQPGFREASAVFWTAHLAEALGAVVLAFVVRMSDTVEVSLSLAALVPGLEWGSLPHLFLDIFKVFSIVTLFFLGLGARYVFRTSKATGWTIGGLYWAVAALVALAFQIFGSWATGRL